MHKNDWIHYNLNGHNITLDCRLIDLDDVEKVYEKDEKIRDKNDARGVLEKFMLNRIYSKEYQSYLNLFEKSYSKAFGKIIDFVSDFRDRRAKKIAVQNHYRAHKFLTKI